MYCYYHYPHQLFSSYALPTMIFQRPWPKESKVTPKSVMVMKDTVHQHPMSKWCFAGTKQPVLKYVHFQILSWKSKVKLIYYISPPRTTYVIPYILRGIYDSWLAIQSLGFQRICFANSDFTMMSTPRSQSRRPPRTSRASYWFQCTTSMYETRIGDLTIWVIGWVLHRLYRYVHPRLSL